MNKIRENLWVGTRDEATDQRWTELKAIGITAILNVAAEVSDVASRDTGMLLCKAGIPEKEQGDIPAIKAAVAMLDYLLNAGNIVYLHCHGGCNRSPYVACLCLARREKKPFNEILNEISAVRPCARNAATIMGRWYGTEVLGVA